jgi:hypothetical protein
MSIENVEREHLDRHGSGWAKALAFTCRHRFRVSTGVAVPLCPLPGRMLRLGVVGFLAAPAMLSPEEVLRVVQRVWYD